MNSTQAASRPEWSDSVNGDTAATKEHADQVEYPSAKIGSTSSSGPHPIRSALGLHEKAPAEVIETTILQFGIFALKDMSNVGAEKFLPGSPHLGSVPDHVGHQPRPEISSKVHGVAGFEAKAGAETEDWEEEAEGHYYFWVSIVAPFIGCTF